MFNERLCKGFENNLEQIQFFFSYNISQPSIYPSVVLMVYSNKGIMAINQNISINQEQFITQSIIGGTWVGKFRTHLSENVMNLKTPYLINNANKY